MDPGIVVQRCFDHRAMARHVFFFSFLFILFPSWSAHSVGIVIRLVSCGRQLLSASPLLFRLPLFPISQQWPPLPPLSLNIYLHFFCPYVCLFCSAVYHVFFLLLQSWEQNKTNKKTLAYRHTHSHKRMHAHTYCYAQVHCSLVLPDLTCPLFLCPIIHCDTYTQVHT